jgi:hypothetical protein
MSRCFICMFFLIIHAITDIFHVKKDSGHNFGTKFADFIRHNMRLKTSFQILFGKPFVFMHREAFQTAGGRRR